MGKSHKFRAQQYSGRAALVARERERVKKKLTTNAKPWLTRHQNQKEDVADSEEALETEVVEVEVEAEVEVEVEREKTRTDGSLALSSEDSYRAERSSPSSRSTSSPCLSRSPRSLTTSSDLA